MWLGYSRDKHENREIEAKVSSNGIKKDSGANLFICTLLGGCDPKDQEVGVLGCEVLHQRLVGVGWRVMSLVDD